MSVAGGAFLSAVITALVMPNLVELLREDGVGCWDTADGSKMCSDGVIFFPVALGLFVVGWILFGTGIWLFARSRIRRSTEILR